MRKIKYPRTPHLPWSLGIQSDDVSLSNVENLKGREIVVTEKMDGENTTMYSDSLHARSLDSLSNETQAWVRQFHSTFCWKIPDQWRVCGENVYAKHSIYYTELPSYFLGFSIWDEKNRCLPWDDTTKWFDRLSIVHPPVLYRGAFEELLLRKLAKELDTEHHEGYVVRVADSFSYSEFADSVAKFVRKGHVQTDKHWKRGKIIPNKLQPERDYILT